MYFVDELTWHDEINAELLDAVMQLEDGIVITAHDETRYAAAPAGEFHAYRKAVGDDDQDPFLLTTRKELLDLLVTVAKPWRT
ncbi:hypothetical protein [Actinomadura atramentaria]|uniref:hypothetical protein n=1 Tax=Actinomadura atramentaria TaxID=1990 RepID=UPI0003826268|nr:hypothetical protein [Actinomadura atramentaria]